MTTKQIKENGKCCACEEQLVSSKHLNMILLDKTATWKFPIAGNVITGEKNKACAFICDPCYDSGNPQIKFAVEFNDTEIKYHPIESL